MYERHKYKEVSTSFLPEPDHVATLKRDGANYFVPVAEDGSLAFISRRESVRGGYPDRTASLPHLTAKKLPQYAGNVYNVELIHTGHTKNFPESHRQLSGILNSLPERAKATQAALGPIRAVLHNVINPDLGTYSEKRKHMEEVVAALDIPEVFFLDEAHTGPAIRDLIESTRRHGREGVIITSLTRPESDNPRLKIKHKLHHNLRISKIIQEVDKNGNLKNSMGAAEVSDASGKVVGTVGTGWSRADRLSAFQRPSEWVGRLIQVESMGLALNKLRSPVYNGDADGDIDLVTS